MRAGFSPLRRALLTRDWASVQDHIDHADAADSDVEQLARAVNAIRTNTGLHRVISAAPARAANSREEALRYLADVAHSKLGTLRTQRSEAFAAAFDALHKQSIVIIATIQKSGTHWMRFFLTNYARVLSDRSESRPISYQELIANFYGNNRWQIFRDAEPYREPAGLLRPHGISDVTMQHFRPDFDVFMFSKGRKIMLYRNPLDYVVSLYHYNIKQRPEKRHRASHPREVIETMLQEYSLNYLTLSSYQADSDVYISSYEDLKNSPRSQFPKVIEFLGLPVEHDAIERALAMSDISTIHTLEHESGRSMVVKLDGYFTRDGSIGQWKKFFNDSDLRRASNVLRQYEIDLNSFALET